MERANSTQNRIYSYKNFRISTTIFLCLANNFIKSLSFLFFMQFTHKYKPKKPSDVIGQDERIAEIKKKIEGYARQKTKKALLVYGPTGTGKTSSIHAIAEELDLEIIEVNASDSRNASSLEENVMPAIKQSSLFGKSKLILIDEIDGLSGQQDRGGVPSIIKIIEESRFPIILTANDPFEQKFNSLRQKCVMIEYKAITVLAMVKHLKDIAKKEGIKAEVDALTALSRKSQGDLRSALNDLENISASGELTKESIELTSDREREESVINALLKVLKTKDPSIALGAFNIVD